MNNASRLLLLAVACVGVGSCDKLKIPGVTPPAPTGQVVATIGGQEVTLRELSADLEGVNVSDPKQRKAAEQSALQQLIARKVLAAEAQKQGVDKTPDFALQRQRALEMLLANALEKKIEASVPATSREEAQRYVSDNPEMFEQHKIYVVDQIRSAPPNAEKLEQELAPLNTMDDVQALLTREGVAFQRGTTEMDSLLLDPQLTQKIDALPPNEVFVVPTPDGVLINQIKQVKPQPVTGEPAINDATQILHARHVREAVSGELQGVLNKAQPTIKFNSAYAPPKPPAAPSGTPASTNATAG